VKQYGELFRHFGQIYDGGSQCGWDGVYNTMGFDEV
jgi:hypothetical protein